MNTEEYTSILKDNMKNLLLIKQQLQYSNDCIKNLNLIGFEPCMNQELRLMNIILDSLNSCVSFVFDMNGLRIEEINQKRSYRDYKKEVKLFKSITNNTQTIIQTNSNNDWSVEVNESVPF